MFLRDSERKIIHIFEQVRCKLISWDPSYNFSRVFKVGVLGPTSAMRLVLLDWFLGQKGSTSSIVLQRR